MEKKEKGIMILILIVIAVITGSIVAGNIIKHKEKKERTAKRQQEREEQLKVYQINLENGMYQDALSIKGECICSLDGVEYPEGMDVNRLWIYLHILEIRVFKPEYEIDYSSIDQLLEEYNSFCDTGNASEILDGFYLSCLTASSRASAKKMQDSIYYIMASLARGSIRIEDGKIIEDYSRDVADIEDFNDEEIIELCRLFEDNSDVIIDWWMGE